MKKLKLMVAVVGLCCASAGVYASQGQDSVGRDDGKKVEQQEKVLTPVELAAKELNDKLEAVTNNRIAAEDALKQAQKKEDEEYLQAGRYGYLKSFALYGQKLEDFIFSVPSQLNTAFWGPVQHDDNFAMQLVKNYSAHVMLATVAVGAGYVVCQRLTTPKKSKNKVVVE